MPKSQSSLESLSSPSPSPPPQPGPASSRKDLSDSELSELTEDEHDSESTKNRRSVASKMTKLDKQASSETVMPASSRHATRRKRGGIVPAPMWEWAKPKRTGAQSPDDDESSESSDTPGDPDDDQQQDTDSANTKSAPGEISQENSASETTAASTVAAGDASIIPVAPPPTIEPLSSLTDPAKTTTASRTATVYNNDAPPPEVIAPIVAAAAASSIMRLPSTRASSEASTPPASPPPPEVTTAGTAKTAVGALVNGTTPHLSLDTSKAQSDVSLRPEIQTVQSPVPMDEGEPDQEAVEMESDVQPAHRAEALDVLAAIELKFALLRERVYVEKMAALAWEESLVNEGVHPEMTHLQAELSKRKDIRLQLASRKRSYELANAKRRRRADEDAVWSWWKLARDELQTEMIAATNRKRRKLERERRAIDRLQPIRSIPEPVAGVLPAPPTFKAIVKESAQSDPLAPSWGESPGSVYPDIPSLGHEDVVHDLQLIFQTRRPVERYGHSQPYDGMGDDGPHPNYGIGVPARNPSITMLPGSSMQNDGEYLGSAEGIYDRRSHSPVSIPIAVGHEQWHGTDHMPTHAGDDVPGWVGSKRSSKDDVPRERTRETETLDPYREFPHHNHAVPRRPGLGPPHHHIGAPHDRHHHHHHHHHIVHHHHPTQPPVPSHSHTPSSVTPQPSSLGHSPRIIPHPDFDSSRPRSGPTQPTELVNLSSKHTMPWKHDSASSHDNDGKLGPLPPMDDRERPMATPFVMASTHTMQNSLSNPNTSSSNGARSPRNSWHPREEDNSFRVTPSTTNYLGSQESYSSNAHRYGPANPANRPPPIGSRPGSGPMGLSPPRHRIPPSPPSSNFSGPLRSPSRYSSMPLPPPTQAPQNRSPVMNKSHHSTSPLTRATPSSSSIYSSNVTNHQRTMTPVEAKGGNGPPLGNRIGSPFVPLYAPNSPPPQSQPAPSRPQTTGPGVSGQQDPPSNVSPSAPSRSLAALLAPVDD